MNRHNDTSRTTGRLKYISKLQKEKQDLLSDYKKKSYRAEESTFKKKEEPNSIRAFVLDDNKIKNSIENHRNIPMGYGTSRDNYRRPAYTDRVRESREAMENRLSSSKKKYQKNVDFALEKSPANAKREILDRA